MAIMMEYWCGGEFGFDIAGLGWYFNDVSTTAFLSDTS